MNNRHAIWITWTLLIIIIVIGTVRILIELQQQDILRNQITTHIEDQITKKFESIEKPKDGINGLNGLNGADGSNGLPGKDGKDGQNGIDGQDGLDGKDAYFDIQCNPLKNRWEVKFNIEDNWSLLQGKLIKCLGV